MAYEPPDEVGETHPKISDAKAVLKRYWYGRAEGLGTTDVDDTITPGFERGFRQYRINIHYDYVRGKRPLGMPDLDPENPDFNWAAQKNMGLLAPAVLPPPAAKPFLALNFPGTWGAHNNGFGWDTMVRLNPSKWELFGLTYNTTAFLIGSADHSYLDMCNDGANTGLAVALPRPRSQRIGLFAYSGGCGAAREFLMRWPADRRDQIAGVFAIGDPNRPPGPTLTGFSADGHGISEDFPPDWVLPRYYSFNLEDDMYGSAVGLLPVFYDILVRLEATPEFIKWFFMLLVDQAGRLTPIGGQLLGVGGGGVPFFGQLSGLLPMITGGTAAGLPQVNLLMMLFNIPAIITTIIAALQFLISQDHGGYADPRKAVFGGMTAIDRAAQIANAL